MAGQVWASVTRAAGGIGCPASSIDHHQAAAHDGLPRSRQLGRGLPGGLEADLGRAGHVQPAELHRSAGRCDVHTAHGGQRDAALRVDVQVPGRVDRHTLRVQRDEVAVRVVQRDGPVPVRQPHLLAGGRGHGDGPLVVVEGQPLAAAGDKTLRVPPVGQRAGRPVPGAVEAAQDDRVHRVVVEKAEHDLVTHRGHEPRAGAVGRLELQQPRPQRRRLGPEARHLHLQAVRAGGIAAVADDAADVQALDAGGHGRRCSGGRRHGHGRRAEAHIGDPLTLLHHMRHAAHPDRAVEAVADAVQLDERAHLRGGMALEPHLPTHARQARPVGPARPAVDLDLAGDQVRAPGDLQHRRGRGVRRRDRHGAGLGPHGPSLGLGAGDEEVPVAAVDLHAVCRFGGVGRHIGGQPRARDQRGQQLAVALAGVDRAAALGAHPEGGVEAVDDQLRTAVTTDLDPVADDDTVEDRLDAPAVAGLHLDHGTRGQHRLIAERATAERQVAIGEHQACRRQLVDLVPGLDRQQPGVVAKRLALAGHPDGEHAVRSFEG